MPLKPSSNPEKPSLKNREQSSPIAPTFRDYLCAQLTSKQLDGPQLTKHERVYNFLHVPQNLEKLLFIGYFVCLDAFLYNFTILPLRIVVSLVSLGCSAFLMLFPWRRRGNRWWLFYNQSDLLKGLMMVGAGIGLQQVDSSRLYHSIRGQSTLKLYVIYNVLEVADKLCCSFGLDILDSFFSKDDSSTSTTETGSRVRPIPHFILTILYVLIHSIILFYQAITLNVAINSYNNALLTLLVSNQFVEIKSAVFKKFEKENLFQLSCADIIERFQLSLYLIIIGFRNLSEMRNSLDGRFVLEGLVVPLSIVYLSEIIVDWLKHAFITKFNHIPPDVYVRFADILAKDFDSDSAVDGEGGAEESGEEDLGMRLADQSPQVSRRIGFSAFPLASLLIRVILQEVRKTDQEGYLASLWRLTPHIFGVYGCLFILKLILGINLAGYCKQRAMQATTLHVPKKKAIPISSSQVFERKPASVVASGETDNTPNTTGKNNNETSLPQSYNLDSICRHSKSEGTL